MCSCACPHTCTSRFAIQVSGPVTSACTCACTHTCTRRFAIQVSGVRACEECMYPVHLHVHLQIQAHLHTATCTDSFSKQALQGLSRLQDDKAHAAGRASRCRPLQNRRHLKRACPASSPPGAHQAPHRRPQHSGGCKGWPPSPSLLCQAPEGTCPGLHFRSHLFGFS